MPARSCGLVRIAGRCIRVESLPRASNEIVFKYFNYSASPRNGQTIHMKIVLKSLCAIVILSALSSHAEIIKYKDPATGMTEYFNISDEEWARLSKSGSKGSREAIIEKLKPQIEARRKQRKEELAEEIKAGRVRSEAIAKLEADFPEMCNQNRKCAPQPGMPIKLAQVAFNLRHDGYTHSAKGRVDRYRMNRCFVYSHNEVIRSITC